MLEELMLEELMLEAREEIEKSLGECLTERLSSSCIFC